MMSEDELAAIEERASKAMAVQVGEEAAMTAADFAANLRAEMGRQGIEFSGLMLRLDAAFRGEEPVPIGFNRAFDLVYCGVEYWATPIQSRHASPTTAEISAIATALGCPVERLTVSREELEAVVNALELNLGFRRMEIADLTAEVERISAERDHYRAENERLREELQFVHDLYQDAAIKCDRAQESSRAHQDARRVAEVENERLRGEVEKAESADSLGCPECGEERGCCCADLFDGWEPLP